MPSREENYRRWLQVQGIDPATAPALGPDPLADMDVPAQVVPSQAAPNRGSGIMDILTGVGSGLKKVFIDPAAAVLQGSPEQYGPPAPPPPQAASVNPALLAPPTAGAPAFEPTTPPAPPKTPEELYMEELQKKRAMLDTLFPERQVAPEQQKADDYAKDMDRTAILARLAFASGLTRAGGGGWEDIGRGLASAGQVMDQGYSRYHQALQNAADRAQKQLDLRYADESARASAAVELASAERKARIEGGEKERKSWLDYFGDIKPSDEALLTDPEAYDNWRKRYEEFMFTGRTSPYGVTDVRD